MKTIKNVKKDIVQLAVVFAITFSSLSNCDSPSGKDSTKQAETEQSGGNENDSIIYRIEENDSLIHITSIPYAEKRKSASELQAENIDFDVTDLPYRYFDIDFDGVDEVIFEDNNFWDRRGKFHYIYRKIGDSLVSDNDLPFRAFRDCYIIDIKNKTVTTYGYFGYDFSYVTFQKDPEKALNPITSDFSDGTKDVLMTCMLEKQRKMKLVKIEEYFYVRDTIDGGMHERVYTADHPEGIMPDNFESNGNYNYCLTSMVWRDSEGRRYPVYNAGSCFVFRLNEETGREYKFYLPDEIIAEIRKNPYSR